MQLSAAQAILSSSANRKNMKVISQRSVSLGSFTDMPQIAAVLSAEAQVTFEWSNWDEVIYEPLFPWQSKTHIQQLRQKAAPFIK